MEMAPAGSAPFAFRATSTNCSICVSSCFAESCSRHRHELGATAGCSTRFTRNLRRRGVPAPQINGVSGAHRPDRLQPKRSWRRRCGFPRFRRRSLLLRAPFKTSRPSVPATPLRDPKTPWPSRSWNLAGVGAMAAPTDVSFLDITRQCKRPIWGAMLTQKGPSADWQLLADGVRNQTSLRLEAHAEYFSPTALRLQWLRHMREPIRYAKGNDTYRTVEHLDVSTADPSLLIALLLRNTRFA